MHLDDGDTTWFGITHDVNKRPVFQDYGRYATLIANSASFMYKARFPRLVSFIGQTGAGKSTLVKMLIERQRTGVDSETKSLFPCPIVGALSNDWVPTSGDVHLYAAPATYFTLFPTFYADCEGLEGGEKIPIGSRARDGDGGLAGNGDSTPDRTRLKKRWRISRGQQRDIAWANSPEKQKRQYGVSELYPRLLYTFSDVVVFVLQNPKYDIHSYHIPITHMVFRTFESTILSKLLGWAAAVMEKSTNQPVLPHAIIALNSTDPAIDPREWDVDFATNTLMQNVAGAVGRDLKYREYAEHWDMNGKPVKTMRDLLECYYSSIRVVRIPRKGRYMQVEEQIQKLHTEIELASQKTYDTKRKSRMLANSDELNQYLQAAFDHFSQNLDAPFNFIDIAAKNSPIPRDFGGNILKLAVAVQDVLRTTEGSVIFEKLGPMVASCIVLDYARHGLKGSCA
jgi:energy-coupling factor transporter ATP-binding protein EcfA2